jgi:hypothetical protein
VKPSNLILGLALIACAAPLFADTVKKPAVVPPGLAFIRTFDAEAYVERQNSHGLGNQTLRLRTRYLDPDVNAFVGMQASVNHFNIDLRIKDPLSPETANSYLDWGINIGMVRAKKHLWELDLQGITLGSSLGFAPAIIGEHRLSDQWTFYHRLELALMTGDNIVDADQGVYWMHGVWGISAGYRIFAAAHMSRSGPRIGVRFLFQSPKVPFLFPSLG